MYNFQCAFRHYHRTFVVEKQNCMNQLSSITPLESILIGIAVVGLFLFFRACWRNIKHGQQD